MNESYVASQNESERVMPDMGIYLSYVDPSSSMNV
jgi:hypothetical protein